MSGTKIGLLLAGLVLVTAGVVFAVLALSGSPARVSDDRGGGVDLAALHRTDADIKVYKTATCGCCSAWVEHLQRHGFAVEAVDVEQRRLNRIKQAAGLTRELASCHTALIDGRVIEGHVPAADIRRFLQSGSEAAGLAVPGMPVGSPGMETGGRREAYDVLVFGEDGRASVYASHSPK